MKKVIIIPARMQSKRFPGKVMYPIAGIPMIIRTWQQAMKVLDCSVYVASDDMDLLRACHEYGVKSYQLIKTGEHRNGTERCAEAARILGLADDDHVLNLQADLPCIQPKLIERVFSWPYNDLVTAAVLCAGHPSVDPNMVKVIIDSKGAAVYFSRAAIPTQSNGWLNHIGIYKFTNRLLQEFADQASCTLERQEDLEQLRIIYYGIHKMYVILTNEDCISINVPSDLEKLNIQWPDEQVIGHVI